jgi:condensin complex subunit 1
MTSISEHFSPTYLWWSSNQCKKFAKPELKVCIEEFEEKLSKVHQEKKEQEETTKNAEAHRQKIGSLDEYLAGKEVGQSSGDPVEGKQKSVHLFLNLFMLYDT